MLKITKTRLLIVITLFTSIYSAAQEKIYAPDLSKIITTDGWKLSNRKFELVDTNGYKAVHFNSQPGDGIAWIENFDFTNGIIEVDIKGKNVMGGSFVGVALRGVDEKTYDAIYFRPFLFMSEDSTSKDHRVQYMSLPEYGWKRLRDEFPGKYENPVVPAPDPNSFFHARIVVEKPKISVFVNGNDKPSLVVEELTGRTGGWIGLWTGNNSEGTFANLKIIKNKNE